MDFDKDYYAILGVLPTAESVVIRAAYKAMLKVYHPDKFKGSKAEAHTKTVELNEAHSILSNQISRSEYDLFRGNIKDKTYTYKESKQPKDDYQSESYALEKDWAIAIKYQPELYPCILVLIQKYKGLRKPSLQAITKMQRGS